MKLRNVLAATAGLTLISAPVFAEAALERSTAPVKGEAIGGENAGIFIALLGGAAIIAGILLGQDDDDDDATSP